MYRLINRILGITSCLYVLLSICALFNFREEMSSTMLISTYFISLVYFASLSFLNSVSSKKRFLLWSFGVIFSLLGVLLLKEIYLWELGNFFGGGFDIKYYERVASVNIDTSLLDFNQVLQNEISVDDWGFFSVMYLVYSFSGSVEVGRILMILANTLAVFVSARYLYGMLKTLGFTSQIVNFIVALFFLSPFCFVITSVGLKENFFVLFIVLSLYFAVKFASNRKQKYLFYSLLHTSLCFFFRPPVAGMLLVTIVAIVFIKERNKYVMLRWGAVLAILALPLFDIIIQKAFGVSLNHLLSVTNYRFRNIGDAQSGWAVNVVGALIGPFPNVTRSDTYGIYYSGILLLKSLLGSFFYVGLYIAWKQKNIVYIPLMLYWLLNVSMYILGGISLDYRYQITVFPVFLCFVALGLEHYKIDKDERRKRGYFILSYSILVLFIILFYNLRGLANA